MKPPKNRNPIARVVTRIKPKVVQSKRKKLLEPVPDENPEYGGFNNQEDEDGND